MRGKKFLVTGGGGFIGKHLLRELANQGAQIVVFDTFSRSSRQELESLGLSEATVFPEGGDIRDFQILKEAMKDVDGVFHLAAMWLLHTQKYPQQAMETNIQGAANVFTACAELNLPVVFSSSASVYGDAQEFPMTEQHPLDSKNLYGATKIAAEKIAVALGEQQGLKQISLRYMNVYGPFQDQKAVYSGVIPKMLEKISLGEDLTLMGDGSQTYDFVTARDVARANIAAMKSKVWGEAFNVGTGVGTTLNDLCKVILELTNAEVQIKYLPYEKGDARQLVSQRVGSTSKARESLGFAAEDDLRTGLRSLIEWRESEKHS